MVVGEVYRITLIRTPTFNPFHARPVVRIVTEEFQATKRFANK
jgi:hypothetical protein